MSRCCTWSRRSSRWCRRCPTPLAPPAPPSSPTTWKPTSAPAPISPGRCSSFAWRLVSGHDNPEIARRGRLVDLIVLGRPDAGDGGVDSAALEAALFDTGRPVLIAGDRGLAIDGAAVAIAWDGSREASRSLSAALPILESAGRVAVVSVGDGAGGNGLDDLAVYLRGHGVDPEIRAVARGERSVADALGRELQAFGADVTIMGAYGHSVIGEFLFGGVTRDMLKDPGQALFLAH
jgi:nucleotide-binding universal stress UspA family protein